MLNKKNYLFIAFAMTLASCTNEELANDINLSKLEANVESASISRVGFDKSDSWSFFWHSGDEIWVNESPMSTQDADKSKTATFTGYGVNTNSGYAVYPYEMAEDKVSGTKLTCEFSNTYDYTDIDEDFFESSQNIPMYAKVENGSAAFKHLSAVAVFKLNDWAFTGKHVFTVKTSKRITGQFIADLASDNPLFETTEEYSDVVTINYARPMDAAAKTMVFYVPIPTGTYDIQVRVKVEGATKLSRSYANKTVGRGDIVWAEYGESTLTGGDGINKTVSNVKDINENILSTSEKELAVTVTDEVTGKDNVIEIPQKLGTETTTFSFTSVANDAKISIVNEEGGSYEGQIIIEVPENVTIPEVVANIPDGEVYIKQGTVTMLVVSSAPNTTIIGANAKVNTLTVEKGNVRIENGGQVTTIQRSSTNEDDVTYVIYEGEIPTEANSDAKIQYISAAEWDLRKAIEVGGTVNLTEDVELSKSLEIYNDVTLNLNGHDITIANESMELGEGDAIIVYKGTFTIGGEGTVTANTRAVWARGSDNPAVVINSGTYVGSKEGGNSEVIYASGNGKITINGGYFKAETTSDSFASPQYAVLNLHNNGAAGCDIIVQGGTYENFNPSDNISENPKKDFVATGYSSVEGSNNTYVVSKGILNEAALVKAIAVGGTVNLSGDIELSKSLEIYNDVTLNLNGHDMTIANESMELGEGDAIIVYKGTFTIGGEGTVTANTRAVWARGSDNPAVVINSGTYVGSKEGGNSEVIYASGNGKITINGGYFKAETTSDSFASPQYAVLNLHNNGAAGCDIIVQGGTYENFNPSVNISENPAKDFVIMGYKVFWGNEEATAVHDVEGDIKDYVVTKSTEEQ